MATVVLISLYDEFCIGLRYVASALGKAGHVAYLVNLKRYLKRAKAEDTLGLTEGYITQVSPFGEFFLNYPEPITAREKELFYDVLARLRPSVVGISVPSYHKALAASLSAEIKQRCADSGQPVFVVWGGVHPTVAPEECLDDADFICIGEGEHAFPELVSIVEKSPTAPHIAVENIWFKRNGEITRNEIRAPINSLDFLAFPQYDAAKEYLVDGDRTYHREEIRDSQILWNYKILTSRGCPFYCTFCIYSTLKARYPACKRLRRRSVENVIEELKAARRRNPLISIVEFEDDIFTINKSWLREFARQYAREIALPFWCYTHPLFCNAEILRLLKDCGIAYINMGIQSGSDRINRELYERKTTREQALRAARLIHEFDIPAIYDFITNNPYETEEDRRATLELLLDLPQPYEIHLGKLAFFPGTTMLRYLRERPPEAPLDESVYRFWNALYLLAAYSAGSRESLLAVLNDTYLRRNPALLWELLLTLARQRETIKDNSRLKEQTRALSEKLADLQRAYSAVTGKRSIRWLLRLANLVK
jgi:anaerobic magnesium-protoporphyrin IX monomethyl ester cyclase